MRGKVHIGTSGWAYPQWKNGFYPKDLKDKDRLAHYATQFNCVEINSSFYGPPREKIVAAWAERVNDNFTFCFKMWRGITHEKKLTGCENDIDAFLDALTPVKGKVGPLLLQLPPGLNSDFMPQLKNVLQYIVSKGFRCAVEFRNISWYQPEIFSLLRDNNSAAVMHDMKGSEHDQYDMSGNFIYMRYHGSGGKYKGSYDQATLQSLFKETKEHSTHGKDIYIFFNNTLGDADKNALSLKNLTK